MNLVSHTPFSLANPLQKVLDRLSQSLTELSEESLHSHDLIQFEQRLHTFFATAEQEVMASTLASLDIDLPQITIDGEVYTRAVRSNKTYFCSSGPLRVERTLYRQGKEKSLSPMELQAGIIDGQWTPLAAKQASWCIAHLTPGESEQLFRQLGNMTPSKSSLERLPKKLNHHWESHRIEFEQQLRDQEAIPSEAVTIAASLDGVMVPLKSISTSENKKPEKACYKEASCATVSYYDAEGARLLTRRMGRMPEHKKATLKSQLAAEVESALKQRPELQLVKVADGAKDNWTYFSEDFPPGVEVVDFYHAVDHLMVAFSSIHGPTKANAKCAQYRQILLEEEDGVEKVIRALKGLKEKKPKNETLRRELNYFRKRRHQMNYATLKERKLPIGSGVIEAACKTLVSQRLKRSGMRWRHEGGQAILNLRGLVQSERFDRGWELLVNCYKANVKRVIDTNRLSLVQ